LLLLLLLNPAALGWRREQAVGLLDGQQGGCRWCGCR
jgi:hypothetical protein